MLFVTVQITRACVDNLPVALRRRNASGGKLWTIDAPDTECTKPHDAGGPGRNRATV